MTTEEDGNTLDGAPPETFVPRARSARRQRRRRELQRRSGARCSRRSSGWRAVAHGEAVGAAERRPAARDRRAQHLSVLAGVHGVVRAPLHQQRRAAGRRLLRDDAGAHPADQAAVRALAHAAAAAVPGAARTASPDVRRSPPPNRLRARRSRGWRNALGARQLRRQRRAGAAARATTPRRSIEQARQLRIHGVDVVNIPDGPRASARMSALSRRSLVEQQAGIETILHYACRDRNLLGMQSDLLGAHAMGVRNLLLITGDPPRVGDYPGRDGGVRRRLDRPDQRRGAAEPRPRHRRPADRRADGVPHRRRGESRGARSATRSCGGSSTRSRPAPSSRSRSRCSTRPASRSSCGSIERRGIPIIAGVMPLESLRHAEFMANEVPGVDVPGGARRADAPGRERRPRRRGRDRDRPRDRCPRSARWCRACRFRRRPERSRRPCR